MAIGDCESRERTEARERAESGGRGREQPEPGAEVALGVHWCMAMNRETSMDKDLQRAATSDHKKKRKPQIPSITSLAPSHHAPMPPAVARKHGSADSVRSKSKNDVDARKTVFRPVLDNPLNVAWSVFSRR